MENGSIKNESLAALMTAAAYDYFLYLEWMPILSKSMSKSPGLMRFRIECRSVVAEGQPRIRDAVIVEAVDAIFAAHMGHIDIALRHDEPKSRWLVEAVIPLDRFAEETADCKARPGSTDHAGAPAQPACRIKA
jgi:hypothetical protein